MAMFAILTAASIYSLSHYEPLSVKRKREYQEKELARKALQEQNENKSQNDNK